MCDLNNKMKRDTETAYQISKHFGYSDHRIEDLYIIHWKVMFNLIKVYWYGLKIIETSNNSNVIENFTKTKDMSKRHIAIKNICTYISI